MSTFTLNSVLDSIRSDVEDVLRNVSDSDLRDMTSSDVCDLLDDNRYFAPEVIYTDAWDIVTGSSFNDYSAEYLDFSACTNSVDCVMQEAQGIIDNVYYSERENIAAEVLEGLQENLTDDE